MGEPAFEACPMPFLLASYPHPLSGGLPRMRPAPACDLGWAHDPQRRPSDVIPGVRRVFPNRSVSNQILQREYVLKWANFVVRRRPVGRRGKADLRLVFGAGQICRAFPGRPHAAIPFINGVPQAALLPSGCCAFEVVL